MKRGWQNLYKKFCSTPPMSGSSPVPSARIWRMFPGLPGSRCYRRKSSTASSPGNSIKSVWKNASSRSRFYGNEKSFSVSSNATQLLAVGIILPPFLFFAENVRCRAFRSIKNRRSVQRTILRAFQGGVGIVLRKNPSFNGCCCSKSCDG